MVAYLVGGGIAAADGVSPPALRAAFLYNFAKFTEWPGAAGASGPLSLCVLDDTAVQGALGELVGTTKINGRQVTVSRGARGERLRTCHIVYVGDSTIGRVMAILEELQGAPILTVSTGDDFVRRGGVVGLYVEGDRMRFAINPDAAQRPGVRLSSRLLQLARILKDGGYDR